MLESYIKRVGEYGCKIGAVALINNERGTDNIDFLTRFGDESGNHRLWEVDLVSKYRSQTLYWVDRMEVSREKFIEFLEQPANRQDFEWFLWNFDFKTEQFIGDIS